MPANLISNLMQHGISRPLSVSHKPGYEGFANFEPAFMVISAILSGELDSRETASTRYFNPAIPRALSKVEDNILDPRKS